MIFFSLVMPRHVLGPWSYVCFGLVTGLRGKEDLTWHVTCGTGSISLIISHCLLHCWFCGGVLCAFFISRRRIDMCILHSVGLVSRKVMSKCRVLTKIPWQNQSMSRIFVNTCQFSKILYNVQWWSAPTVQHSCLPCHQKEKDCTKITLAEMEIKRVTDFYWISYSYNNNSALSLIIMYNT
jgi:hypothetical protein